LHAARLFQQLIEVQEEEAHRVPAPKLSPAWKSPASLETHPIHTTPLIKSTLQQKSSNCNQFVLIDSRPHPQNQKILVNPELCSLHERRSPPKQI
jgi:hypothetical protein